MNGDLSSRLETLERKNRRLHVLVGILLAVVVAGAVALYATDAGATDAGAAARIVRAEQVVIEDANGVVRARLGADLPDAVVDGRRIPRGAEASGLLLYDQNGHERSGYVTFDNGNVLLTLDAGAAGGNRQTAYFMADSAGATALRIWSGDDHVELRAGAEDGARLNAVADGELVFQRPEIADPASTAMCRELRELTERVGLDQLMEACRQRMSEEGCGLCLGGL